MWHALIQEHASKPVVGLLFGGRAIGTDGYDGSGFGGGRLRDGKMDLEEVKLYSEKIQELQVRKSKLFGLVVFLMIS